MNDNYEECPAVVAFDPGGTTGWCVLVVHPSSLADNEIRVVDNILLHTQGQFTGSENDMAAQMLELCNSYPAAAIVMENFRLRKYSANPELLSPVRIIAKFGYGLYLDACTGSDLPLGPRKVWEQAPVLAMNTATDARLKSWHLYRREGGEVHARDACRHAITALRRAKASERMRKTAWPEIYG